MSGIDLHHSNPLYRHSDFIRQRQEGCDLTKDIHDLAEQGWTPFQKDYARLLHSSSFRRLQGKTQLFPSSEDDFFRNRLTHSLEVAQVAAGIARYLNTKLLKQTLELHGIPCAEHAEIDIDLVQFAGLAHDLGHPPFGHQGEYALNIQMLGDGGYEGNAQTLRILSYLEQKMVGEPPHFGLNLTFRSLASILKYDHKIESDERHPKGYYNSESTLVNEIKEHVAPGYQDSKGIKKFKTIECSIMDIADDIAYSTYDLEDTLHAGFITPLRLTFEFLSNSDIIHSVVKKTNSALQKVGHSQASHEELLSELSMSFGQEKPFSSQSALSEEPSFIRAITYNEDQRLIGSLGETYRNEFTSKRIGELIKAVEIINDSIDPNHPQLLNIRLERQAMINVELLKHLNYEINIRSPRLTMVEFRGREFINQTFVALEKSNGSLLPQYWRHKHQTAEDKSQKRRIICDYIATMTDKHAAEIHGRIFGDGESIFKPF